MNTTTTPRVEVTPELLDSVLDRCKHQRDKGDDGIVVSVVGLEALVERIRELESEVWGKDSALQAASAHIYQMESQQEDQTLRWTESAQRDAERIKELERGV